MKKTLPAVSGGDPEADGAMIVYTSRESREENQEEKEELGRDVDVQFVGLNWSPPSLPPLAPWGTLRPYPGSPPPILPRPLPIFQPAGPACGGRGGSVGGGACGGGVGGVGVERGTAACKGGAAVPSVGQCFGWKQQCLDRGETSGSLRSAYEVYIDYDDKSK